MASPPSLCSGRLIADAEGESAPGEREPGRVRSVWREAMDAASLSMRRRDVGPASSAVAAVCSGEVRRDMVSDSERVEVMSGRRCGGGGGTLGSGEERYAWTLYAQ